MRRASGTGWHGKPTVGLALVLAAGLTTAVGAESVLRMVPQADPAALCWRHSDHREGPHA
jgi:hypothetical protein